MPAPKTKFAAVAAPRRDQLARLFAHRHCHLDRTLGRVGARYWVVEEHHDAVAGKLVERALELAVEEPGRRIVKEQLLSEGTALPWIDGVAFARRAIALALSDRKAARRTTGHLGIL